MDDICLPVRYDALTERDVQGHLRYCAGQLSRGYCAELLLCEVGIVIPIVKKVFKTKDATLNVHIRSGSIAQDQLIRLRERLSAEDYPLKVSVTRKKKLIKRIIVPLVIDEGTVATSGLNVLRVLADEIDLAWPCTMAVGYALGSESPELPGSLRYRERYRNMGYQMGLAV